jgi:hypothetical protein
VLPIGQPLLGLVNDARNTYLGLVFLVITDHCDKLTTTMKISNLFVGLAEYSAIRMKGIKFDHQIM